MSAQIETIEGREQESRIAVEIIDSDVHGLARDGLQTVWEYIPKAWQERFMAKGSGLAGQSSIGVSTKTMRFSHPTAAGLRADTVSPKGGPPGSDPDFMRTDFLDRWDIDVAILNSIDAAAYAAGLANPDETTVILEANNRYFIEQWLPLDNRLKFLLGGNPQDPIACAAEIRRAGGEPGVVGIFLPPTNILMGNRHYHPIYEAAAEFDLPIWTHVTGIEYIYQGSAVYSGGFPESYSERRAASHQVAESNVSSIVFSGVLERFPNIRFCFAEFGFAWALPLMWRMDDTWRACRRDTPWVTKSPTEYVRERIRFTTQPLSEPANAQDLLSLIEMLGPETLMFSSDYPHWDNDNPHRVLASWSEEIRNQICSTSPRKFWRL
jgi:predicted TIM-barrel fold metal-dependent hydrolase